MALGWAIYGTWDWKHDGYVILVHVDLNTRFFSHEIFWTRIARITRIFLAHGAFLREVFGTRISDFAFGTLNTRFFWTRITRILFCTRISLSRILCSWCLNTNLTNNTNFIWHTDIIFFAHGSHESHGFWAFGSLWMTARCGYWLVVVIGLLWLLTCCGYWLVVV